MDGPLVTDGLTNMVAELNTARDKAASATYNVTEYNDQELVAAYRTSWLARKVVDIPAQDSAREWRAWQGEEDQIEKIEEEERRHGIQAKVLRALTLGRLYGAAYLYFDLGDNPEKLVQPKNVKTGGLRFVTVLSHAQLVPGDHDQDPLSPTYGRPLWYQTANSSMGVQRVHPSRIVRFGGAPRPEQEMLLEMRDDSVLVALLESIKQFDATSANISSLVYEAKVDVISVNGLMNIAGNPYEERKLLDRYRLAATAKGNNGMLILDGENEEYQQKSFTFSALSDIMDRFAQNSSGAADIPMTRLFGRSPGGMNSTGDSDLRNYYDRIKADQNLRIRPALTTLDECLLYSALGSRPEELHYLWNSLWQVSDKERSDLGTSTVAMIKNLKETGLIPDEVLAKVTVTGLTQAGAMPGLEGEYAAFFEEGGEWDLEQEEPPMEPGPKGPQGGGKPIKVGDNTEQPRAPKGSPNGGQWVGRAGSKQNPIPLSTYTQDKGNFDWAVRDIERQIAESDDHEEFVKAVSPGALTTTQDYVSESGRGDAQGGVFPDLGDDYGDDYPVVAVIKETGEHLLIDGNHRMAQALTKHPNDKVYAWVFEVSLPKKQVADEQPRAPKGSPNGGQWVKAGTGSGGLTAAQSAAVAKITTSKYSAEKLAELAKKPAKELGPYEYHMAKKYKKALATEGSKEAVSIDIDVAAATKMDPALAIKHLDKYGSDSGLGVMPPEVEEALKKQVENAYGTPDQIASSLKAAEEMHPNLAKAVLNGPDAEALHPNAKAILEKKVAAAEAAEIDVDFEPLDDLSPAAKTIHGVTTNKYTEAKLQELLNKDPKTLGPYEKHKLKQYKKALQADKANLESALPKTGAVDPYSAQAKAEFAKIGASHYGMNAETIQKLATGEWQPDLSKPWQAKAKTEAEEYLKTGKIQAQALKINAPGSTSKAIESVLLNTPPPTTNHTTPQTNHASVGALTSAEKMASTKYTGTVYSAINGHLRTGNYINEEYGSYIPKIDSAIKKSVALEDMVVVRGVRREAVQKWLVKNNLSNLKEGSTIIDYGFVSTTRKAGVAANFGGNSTSQGFGLKIRVPKGSNILPLKTISQYAHEDEFLLPRGSAFKIAAVDEDQSLLILDLVQ